MGSIDPAIEFREAEDIAKGAIPSPSFNRVLILVRIRGSKRASITKLIKKIKAEVSLSTEYEVKSFIKHLKIKLEELKKLDDKIQNLFTECDEFSFDGSETLSSRDDHYNLNILILINELEGGKVEWEKSSDVLGNEGACENLPPRAQEVLSEHCVNTALDACEFKEYSSDVNEGVCENLPRAQEVISEQSVNTSLDVCEFKEYSSDINEVLIPCSKKLENESADAVIVPLRYYNTFTPIFKHYYPILTPSFYNFLQIYEINLNQDLVTASLITKSLVPKWERSKVMLEADTLFPSRSDDTNNLVAMQNNNFANTESKCKFIPIFEILNITLSAECFLRKVTCVLNIKLKTRDNNLEYLKGCFQFLNLVKIYKYAFSFTNKVKIEKENENPLPFDRGKINFF